jgi:hypothetical protein
MHAFKHVSIIQKKKIGRRNKQKAELNEFGFKLFLVPRVENSNFLLQDLRDLCSLLGITG